MSFGSDIARFSAKAKQRQRLALRKTSIELFGRVIMRTPVDTGRLRGNWQATGASPAVGVTDIADAAAPASQNGSGNSISRTAMETFILGDGESTVFHLANNLPYATVVEYGSSQQAPSGMVRISVAEFEGIVGEITNALP